MGTNRQEPQRDPLGVHKDARSLGSHVRQALLWPDGDAFGKTAPKGELGSGARSHVHGAPESRPTQHGHHFAPTQPDGIEPLLGRCIHSDLKNRVPSLDRADGQGMDLSEAKFVCRCGGPPRRQGIRVGTTRRRRGVLHPPGPGECR